MTTDSLREKKRRATAHALAQAAFDLALERGVDGFTIDEVATRAGYSRRTFANHYAGKEEAIAAVATVLALTTSPIGRVNAHLLVGAAYGALSGVLDGKIPVRLNPSTDHDSDANGSITLTSFLDLTFTKLRRGFSPN